MARASEGRERQGALELTQQVTRPVATRGSVTAGFVLERLFLERLI